MRKLIVAVHLYVGLLAAAFLIVLSFSGAILVFGNDYDRWLHPALWSVTPHGRPSSPQTLAEMVDLQFAPARVVSFVTFGNDCSDVFVLSDHKTVFVDPYDGAIRGSRDRPVWIDSFVSRVRGLHTHLVHVQIGATDLGEALVDFATVEVIALIPTGIYLWWKKKRLSVRWKASWSRLNWDLHRCIGICSATFLLLISVTGLFVAFDKPLFWVTHSSPQPSRPRPHSKPPEDMVASSGLGSARVNLDAVIRVADAAFPGAPTTRVDFPRDPRGVYTVVKQHPKWVAGSLATQVYVDQYTGKVLRVDDARETTRGYRARNIIIAFHTGEILGTPTKIIFWFSSLALSFLAITGVVIGFRKFSWIAAVCRSKGNSHESMAREANRADTEKVDASLL